MALFTPPLSTTAETGFFLLMPIGGLIVIVRGLTICPEIKMIYPKIPIHRRNDLNALCYRVRVAYILQSFLANAGKEKATNLFLSTSG